MEGVLIAIVALACPIGMGVMMWFMGKGMMGKKDQPPAQSSSDLDALREEHRRLGAEIDRFETESPKP